MGVTETMQAWNRKRERRVNCGLDVKKLKKKYIIKKEKVALYGILKELMFFLKIKIYEMESTRVLIIFR